MIKLTLLLHPPFPQLLLLLSFLHPHLKILPWVIFPLLLIFLSTPLFIPPQFFFQIPLLTLTLYSLLPPILLWKGLLFLHPTFVPPLPSVLSLCLALIPLSIHPILFLNFHSTLCCFLTPFINPYLFNAFPGVLVNQMNLKFSLLSLPFFFLLSSLLD